MYTEVLLNPMLLEGLLHFHFAVLHSGELTRLVNENKAENTELKARPPNGRFIPLPPTQE